MRGCVERAQIDREPGLPRHRVEDGPAAEHADVDHRELEAAQPLRHGRQRDLVHRVDRERDSPGGTWAATALHRVRARGGVEKLVLRDAQGAVPDLLGREVHRHEHVRLVAARREPVFRAQKSQFFLHGRDKDQIAFRLDVAPVERAEHLEGRQQVGRVVANAGRAQHVAFALHRQIGAVRKHRIRVRAEHDRWPTAGALAHTGHIRHVVDLDVGEADFLHLRLDVRRACLLFGRGRRDLH